MRRQLELNKTTSNGIRLYETLTQALKSLKEGTEEYNKILNQLELNIPACGQHIWDWFWELRKTAGVGFSSPNPITYTEIYAWQLLNHIIIYPWEIKIIRKLDETFLAYAIESNANKKKT